MRITFSFAALAMAFAVCGAPQLAEAQLTVHDTAGTVLPHDDYIQVVSEAISPLEKLYVKTGDGLYVAATIRKPKGDGPFPAMILFHGAPGGRGMEQLVNWSLGKCGGPVWERLLQEGYVVVVGDYRGSLPKLEGPATAEPPAATPANAMAADATAILDYVRTLPYVDTNRIGLYGVSLGGDVVLHVAARTKVRAVVLGAPAARNFIGAQRSASGNRKEDYTHEAGPAFNAALARQNVRALQNETLLLVGTKDGLLPLTRTLFNQMAAVGKPAELHIYKNGYHDFPMGPQCHDPVRFPQPFIDATKDSLELTVAWLKRVME